ncbi:MAG: 30S ribosomal protein S18 [Pseudomonadota bacterium]
MEFDVEKDRRNFSKRKSCWFTAKKICADWKDPGTYSWLISEFGKITPARISGISAKHQRIVTQTIKRALQLGLCSQLSGRIAQ